MKTFCAKTLVKAREVRYKLRKHKISSTKLMIYFVAGTLLDLLIAKEYIYITAGLAMPAALVSVIITLISTYIISRIITNDSSDAMFFYALGNGLGTLLAI